MEVRPPKRTKQVPLFRGTVFAMEQNGYPNTFDAHYYEEPVSLFYMDLLPTGLYKHVAIAVSYYLKTERLKKAVNIEIEDWVEEFDPSWTDIFDSGALHCYVMPESPNDEPGTHKLLWHRRRACKGAYRGSTFQVHTLDAVIHCLRNQKRGCGSEIDLSWYFSRSMYFYSGSAKPALVL